MSTHPTTTRPHQLRLPGQADAPEGPVDMSMMYVLHHAFRRDLAAFAQVVPRTPVADRAAWRALQRRWEVFAELLHHHHEGEDSWIWPVLLERADDEEVLTLSAMEAEHAEIDPLLDACRSGLAALADGDAGADERAALAVRFTAARESLGRHLAHEERDAMRVLQRHLSADDFAEIEEHLRAGLSARLMRVFVPWATHGLPEDARRRLLAEAPLPLRAVWHLTHRRFARSERATFAALAHG